MILPSAERELFFLHYYLIIISFLVLVLSFPFSVLSFSATFFFFFSFLFHYLGIHDMTKRSREGRFRLVQPKQKKKEKKSLGITLFWSGYGAFIFVFYISFSILSSGISYYSPLSTQSSIHPSILTLPLTLII